MNTSKQSRKRNKERSIVSCALYAALRLGPDPTFRGKQVDHEPHRSPSRRRITSSQPKLRASIDSLPSETIHAILTFAVAGEAYFPRLHLLSLFSLVQRTWQGLCQSLMFEAVHLEGEEECTTFLECVARLGKRDYSATTRTLTLRNFGTDVRAEKVLAKTGNLRRLRLEGNWQDRAFGLLQTEKLAREYRFGGGLLLKLA